MPPTTALGPWVTVHRLDSSPGRGLVAVRPDGHIGYRATRVDLTALRAWLDLVAAG